MFDKFKKKIREESLLMKVETITDNIHVNTKRHTLYVRLIELCDEEKQGMENTSLVFAALRARLSDGLIYNRHLSVIKVLWLIELLAKVGPLVVHDFLPTTCQHLEKAAHHFANNCDSVFFPVVQKVEELLDMIQGKGGSAGGMKMTSCGNGDGIQGLGGHGFSREEAVRMCLGDMDAAIKKINQSLKAKISRLAADDDKNGIGSGHGSPLGSNIGSKYEDMMFTHEQNYQEELLSLLESALNRQEDQVDMNVLEDLLTNLRSSSEESEDVAAVLRTLKTHLPFPEEEEDEGEDGSFLTAEKAVQCRKVFEILNYFMDHGIVIDTTTPGEIFCKEDLQEYATNFKFEVAGFDYGYDVRREASRFLDLPIIGSFTEEGGVDVSEVSISFNGSLSRFDLDDLHISTDRGETLQDSLT